eukprot:7455344-Alexandrium_andersonii.AAC.1
MRAWAIWGGSSLWVCPRGSCAVGRVQMIHMMTWHFRVWEGSPEAACARAGARVRVGVDAVSG